MASRVMKPEGQLQIFLAVGDLALKDDISYLQQQEWHSLPEQHCPHETENN